CAAAWASGSAPNRLPQKQAATAPAASGDRSPSPIGARAPRLVFGEWIEALVGEHLKLPCVGVCPVLLRPRVETYLSLAPRQSTIHEDRAPNRHLAVLRLISALEERVSHHEAPTRVVDLGHEVTALHRHLGAARRDQLQAIAK